jgi:hypothetical protein
VSGLALAAEPVIYLQDTQVVANGKDIYIYRLPVKGSDGVLRYFDLRLEQLLVDGLANGVNTDRTHPGGAKFVSRASSSGIPRIGFLAGEYTGPGTSTCTLSGPGVSGAYTSYSLQCEDATGHDLSASWTTGPLDGHPAEADLYAKDIFVEGDEAKIKGRFWGSASAGFMSGTSCLENSDGVLVEVVGGAGGFTLTAYKDEVAIADCTNAFARVTTP